MRSLQLSRATVRCHRGSSPRPRLRQVRSLYRAQVHRPSISIIVTINVFSRAQTTQYQASAMRPSPTLTHPLLSMSSPPPADSCRTKDRLTRFLRMERVQSSWGTPCRRLK